MPENQTVETDASVTDFVNAVAHDTRRADAQTMIHIMRRVTRTEPKMWGPAIIGFGRYHYRYESGREGDMLRVGFSPRKANLALYLIVKTDETASLLAKLGKYKSGASCLYINRLQDVDLEILEQLVRVSWDAARAKYGEPT